jgi:prepilin-type N-terminal cleavage/methylation domain-containing protein
MRTYELGTTRRRGFTMLEMLIVLAMIGLVATISLGRVMQMVTGWRVARASQAFAEELQSGFALVGRNRKPLTIAYDTARMELRLEDRAGVVYRRRSFGPSSEYQLTARDVASSRLSVEVYPPGLAGDSLSFSITKPGKSRRVRMLRGGLVQICASGATSRCD